MSTEGIEQGEGEGAGERQPGKRGISRRGVLKWLGIGVGGVVVATAGTAGVRGALNGVWNSGAGAPYELWSAWPSMTGVESVVAAGILAAIPHNTQRWRIDVRDDTVRISSDASRRMHLNDASGREHIAGIGCAVENMVVAARAQGLDARVTAFPAASDPTLVAVVELTPGSPATAAEADLAATIVQRHTDRGPYSTEPLTREMLSELDSVAGADEPARLVTIDDAEAKRGLGELYVQATEAIVGDREQSVEAFSWFRNDRADIDRHRDGLTLDCQGFDEFTLAMARILPASSREDGDRFWVNATRDVHTATAAAYGVVVVDDVLDPRAQFAGGRLLERLHLHAARLGLGFQHMNQITERIDHAKATGAPDTFSEPWVRLTGVPAAEGLLSFRIGYPTREAKASPRRALGDVVTFAG